jgi:hypothetical protein
MNFCLRTLDCRYRELPLSEDLQRGFTSCSRTQLVPIAVCV